MTALNSARCIERTIDKYEGGYDNDSRDRGNWTSGEIGKGELKGTKYGIAAHVYPKLDIKNLSKGDAIKIYRRDYWPKVAGDDLPVGADFTAWDCCVNSGSGRYISLCGKLGFTGKASDIAKRIATAGTTEKFIKDFNAARRAFLIGLRNMTYQKGWLARVADCEAVSLAWHYADTMPKTAAIKKMNAEVDASAKTAAKTATATAGSGTAGTVTVGQATQQGFDWLSTAQIGLGLVIIGLTVFLCYKFLVHRQRTVALRAVTQEMGG